MAELKEYKEKASYRHLRKLSAPHFRYEILFEKTDFTQEKFDELLDEFDNVRWAKLARVDNVSKEWIFHLWLEEPHSLMYVQEALNDYEPVYIKPKNSFCPLETPTFFEAGIRPSQTTKLAKEARAKEKGRELLNVEIDIEDLKNNQPVLNLLKLLKLL